MLRASMVVLLAFFSCAANAQQAWRDDASLWPKSAGLMAAPASSSRSYSKAAFERFFIEQPVPRKIVYYNGKAFEDRVAASGAFRGNEGRSAEGVSFSVEGQRNAYFLIAAGIVAGAERNQLLDTGLRALEWTFDRQGADGSFPQGGKTESIRILHPRSIFLSAAARSLRLLRQSPDIDGSFKSRAEALVPKLHRSATWIANSKSLEPFFEQKKNTNQHLFIVLTLHEAGLLTGDQALLEKARQLMSRTLARQTPDGTFPEATGFDFSYQTVSLDLLARYTSTISDEAYRRQLSAALEKGIGKLLQNIRPDGSVVIDDNTRTAACSTPVPGPGPKGRDIDEVPRRLYYFGYLLDTVATLGPIADRLELRGQGFAHIDECDSNGSDKHSKKKKH